MDADPVPFEVEVDEPALFPIGHQQPRLTETRIDGEAVRGVELLFIRTLAAEGFQQLSTGVELVDDVRAVAHRGENRAVRRDGDTSEAAPAARDFAGGGIRDFQQNFPIGIQLTDPLRPLVPSELGTINHSITVFLADRHRMKSPALWGDGADQFPIWLINDHRELRICGNVNQAAHVIHHHAAVGRADDFPVRQLAPMRHCLVRPSAISRFHRRLRIIPRRSAMVRVGEGKRGEKERNEETHEAGIRNSLAQRIKQRIERPGTMVARWRKSPNYVRNLSFFPRNHERGERKVFERIHAADNSTNRMANHSLEISALISISDFPNTCQGAGLAKKTSICAY